MKDASMWIYKEYIDLLEDLDAPIDEPILPKKVEASKFCACEKPNKVKSEAMREAFWYCRCCKKEWIDKKLNV